MKWILVRTIIIIPNLCSNLCSYAYKDIWTGKLSSDILAMQPSVRSCWFSAYAVGLTECACWEGVFMVWLKEHLSASTHDQEPLKGRVQLTSPRKDEKKRNHSNTNQWDLFKAIPVLLFICWLCRSGCWYRCAARIQAVWHRRAPWASASRLPSSGANECS